MAALKAHEVLSVDKLSPLMGKSSSKVMSSHIQKLVQVCVVGCIYFFFSLALLLLREIFVGFGGDFVRFWKTLGLGEEGGYVQAYNQVPFC